MSFNPDIFKIQTNNVIPRKGRILIAEPFLSGRLFNRSIILLTAHGEKGTVGFIINKWLEVSIQDYIPDFPDFDAPVFIGGPVSTDSIYFIHNRSDVITGGIQVLNDIFWGGDFDELKKSIALGMIKPRNVRFFMGYSGWDAGQLNLEIKENSWLINDVEPNMIMGEKVPSWIDFVKRVGNQYSIWANFPEDPSLN